MCLLQVFVKMKQSRINRSRERAILYANESFVKMNEKYEVCTQKPSLLRLIIPQLLYIFHSLSCSTIDPDE